MHIVSKNHEDSDFYHDTLGQVVAQFFMVWFEFLSREKIVGCEPLNLIVLVINGAMLHGKIA